MTPRDEGTHEAPAVRDLDRAECTRLLERGGVGRLAIRSEDAPEIRPVNFTVHGGDLVVRTGAGRIYDAAERAEPASFEIDGITPLEHTGWSVIVTGKLRALDGDPSLRSLRLRPWASGAKDRFVSLSIDRVSGMLIPPGRGNR